MHGVSVVAGSKRHLRFGHDIYQIMTLKIEYRCNQKLRLSKNARLECLLERCDPNKPIVEGKKRVLTGNANEAFAGKCPGYLCSSCRSIDPFFANLTISALGIICVNNSAASSSTVDARVRLLPFYLSSCSIIHPLICITQSNSVTPFHSPNSTFHLDPRHKRLCLAQGFGAHYLEIDHVHANKCVHHQGSIVQSGLIVHLGNSLYLAIASASSKSSMSSISSAFHLSTS